MQPFAAETVYLRAALFPDSCGDDEFEPSRSSIGALAASPSTKTLATSRKAATQPIAIYSQTDTQLRDKDIVLDCIDSGS
jgi:hypothetical protein